MQSLNAEWLSGETSAAIASRLPQMFPALTDAEISRIRDAHGFVLTGQAVARAADGHTRAPLESSVPGVFAVGDVRSGSVKRVGGAIGEGAAAVALIHQHVSGWH